MKRTVCLLLTLAMILTLFAGCGSTAQAAETEPAAEAETTAAEAAEVTAEPAEETAETSADLTSALEALSFDAMKDSDPAKRVVYLQGSWYEMGVQYATFEGDVIRRQVIEGISNLNTYYGYGFEATYEAVDAYLEAYETSAPEYLEFYRGAADTLGVDFKILMTGVCADCFTDKDFACSTATAWGEATGDGRTLVASNWDTVLPNIFYTPIVVAYPDDGNAFVSSNGFMCSCTMNELGVVSTGASGQTGGEGDTDNKNLSLPLLSGYVLEAARYDSAKEILDASIANGDGGGNHSIHDLEGNHYMLEMTCAHYAVRESGDFGEQDYLICTNDFMCEEMQSSLYPAGSGYDDCRPRYWTEERVILDDFGHVNLETMARSIGSSGYYDGSKWILDNWNLETGLNSPECVDPNFQTMLKTLCDPVNSAMYVMNGCGNTLVSTMPRANGNYVQVKLLSTPAEVNSEARYAANMLIYNAGAILYRSEDDISEQEENLNIAKEALLKGDILTMQAGAQTDANEALRYYGLATSQYTRAQSFAQLAAEDPYAILNLE